MPRKQIAQPPDAPFLEPRRSDHVRVPLVDENGNPWPRLFARFTDTKESDVVRYVRLAFEAQRHSGKDDFDVVELAPEDAIIQAVKAHLDKHFEDMFDVPAGSCISIITDFRTLHYQCKVLVAIQSASSNMVDKITGQGSVNVQRKDQRIYELQVSFSPTIKLANGLFTALGKFNICASLAACHVPTSSLLMRLWCSKLSGLGWGQSARPEYHDLEQEPEGVRQVAKDAQLSYQHALHQSNLKR
ncbi:BQ5605_C004g02720 [Microbotryum silenes-dioicae]|uniref:BQ5605_C004g02720 protein n=1 Tax=Microbotryum silenes-dioicae TaxID=796604 RepID=A0A2X0M8I7_9BASI|nr:BQ5605_C004g02720 [Microbotryum silenes-dioicae]